MSEKQLIEKYYKTNNEAHFSDGKYSKTYTKWLERQVMKLSKVDKEVQKTIKFSGGM